MRTALLGLAFLAFAACQPSSPAADAQVTSDARADVDPQPDVPVAADASVPDSGVCDLPGFGPCPAGTTCQTGRCPDGTPVSCFCSPELRVQCTGACPPVPDGGLGCGQLLSRLVSSDCAPATPLLDTQTCRCILGYLWDGTQCVSSARCHCYAGCEKVFGTIEDCRAAYVHCGG